MNFRIIPAVAALTLGVFALSVSPTFAATATGTFPVTATVANTCTVSATGVAFGSYTGVLVTNTSNTISLTCNKGVTITSLYLNDGANPAGGVKQMANGTERLAYAIDVPTGAALNTCPAVGSNSWNTTTGPAGLTALFTTTAGLKPITICASIPAGQFPAGGAYTDTVTMTLTYN